MFRSSLRQTLVADHFQDRSDRLRLRAGCHRMCCRVHPAAADSHDSRRSTSVAETGIDATAQRLAENEDIGPWHRLVMLDRQTAYAGASKPGLNLVEHQIERYSGCRFGAPRSDTLSDGTLIPASACIGSTRNATVLAVIAAVSWSVVPEIDELEAGGVGAEVAAIFLVLKKSRRSSSCGRESCCDIR